MTKLFLSALLVAIAVVSSMALATEVVKKRIPTEREILKREADDESATPAKIHHAVTIVAPAVQAAIDARLGGKFHFDTIALVTHVDEIEENVLQLHTKFSNDKYSCDSVAASRLKEIRPPLALLDDGVIDQTIREVNIWDTADVTVTCIDAHSGAPVDHFKMVGLGITGADRGVFHVDGVEFTPTWSGKHISSYSHEPTPNILVRSGREIEREVHHGIWSVKRAL